MKNNAEMKHNLVLFNHVEQHDIASDITGDKFWVRNVLAITYGFDKKTRIITHQFKQHQ